MHPFEIEADADLRTLRLHFRATVTAQTLQEAADRSAALIAAMKPGFIVVADLSELHEMELDCVPHITRMMDQFRRANVGRVIRIIPDESKDIGFTLLSHTHYRGAVPFETVATRSEAQAALATYLR